MPALLLLYFIGFLAVPADFILFLIKGKRDAVLASPVWAFGHLLFSIGMLWFADLMATNNCCGDWSLLAPKHRLSVYALIFLCAAAYFYSALRSKTAPPLMEILVNCLLIAGLGLNIVVSIQDEEHVGWIILIPHNLLLIMMLAQNHLLMVQEMGLQNELPLRSGRVVQFCWYLLRLPVFVKFPVLLILCLPVLLCLSAVLLIFGQQPDSLVRAFTDTYKHGLSQLEPNCNGVVCGGHFLCTIAAKGSPGLVKPLRAGVRAGAPIKCNRQLLVSNAFEEWLEQHTPRLHRPVRRLYNHVGSYLHRHYGVFDRKWVSNLVYLLMKPLEWIFLLTLYMLDRHPETRIAQQYMRREDREKIAVCRRT